MGIVICLHNEASPIMLLAAVSKLKVHLSKSEIVPMGEFEDNSRLWQISYVVPTITDL